VQKCGAYAKGDVIGKLLAEESAQGQFGTVEPGPGIEVAKSNGLRRPLMPNSPLLHIALIRLCLGAQHGQKRLPVLSKHFLIMMQNKK